MADIEIKDKYYEKFAERAPEKGFDTAEEYVDYVLGQIYEKLERQQAGAQEASSTDNEVSEADEQKVKDRLRGLGYLD